MSEQPPPQPDSAGGMGGNEFTRSFGKYSNFEPLKSIHATNLSMWMDILMNANLARSATEIKPEYMRLLHQARANAERQKPT